VVNSVIVGTTGLYILLMLAIGYYYRDRAGTEDGFLVADRSIGSIVGGGALAVTYISTASLLGTTSFGYSIGISFAVFGGLGVIVGFFVAMYYLGPQLRSVEASTLPDYFENQLGRRSKEVSALIIAIVMTVYLIAQVRGGALVAQSLLDLSYTWAVILVGVVFVLYTFLGGMFAITVTSFLQAVMAVLGVLVVSAAALTQFGGFGSLLTQVSQQAGYYATDGGRLGIGFALGFGVMIFMSILCAPHVIFRYFASKDIGVARDSAAVASAFSAVFYAVMIVPPAAAILLVPGLENTDQAYLALIQTLFDQPLILGFLFAGILAAAMSTADAMLMNATSALVHDLGGEYLSEAQQENASLYLRIATVIVGALVILLTISPPGLILTIMIIALSLFIGSFFAPVLLSLWVAEPSDVAGVTAMVVGFATAAVTHPETPLVQLSQSPYAGIVGGLVSVIVFLVVNFLSTGSSPTSTASRGD
jgi:SSS family transporter